MTLALDGKANNNGTTSATLAATLTTTLTDDIIVAIVEMHSNSLTSTVSGVSGAGLTWARRSSVTYAVANFAGDLLTHEVWWAHAPSALSAQVITASFANIGSAAYQTITVFGVNGCSVATPWDSNVSLPASANSATATQTTALTVSTTNTNTFLLTMLSDDHNPAAYTADAGDTLIYSYQSSPYLTSASEYKVLAAALSSSAITPFSGQATDNYIIQIDALQGPVPAPTVAYGRIVG